MKTLRTSIGHLLFYTLILGVVYPAVVTALGQLLFYEQAIGSPIVEGEKVIGSQYIGQEFKGEKYFSSRPSATSSVPYNPESSSGSNLSLTNPAFQQQLKERVQFWGGDLIPIDLITASGSGLDPEISIAAARFQVEKIAAARGINEQRILTLIANFAQDRVLGILGEPRVNVLLLNIELDKL